MDAPYFETLQQAINNERESCIMRRALLMPVNNDAVGETRRRNISQLSSGIGGGDPPFIHPAAAKPMTAQYNTARGSYFN